MNNFLTQLKLKIDKSINPEEIELIDNSDLHRKHKSFNIDKLHLRLIIKSKKLNSMSKVEAHKLIFSILKNEMKNKIHALEIKIK